MSEGQRRIQRLAVDGHELPAARIMAESFTIDHGRGMLHMTVRFDALQLEYSPPAPTHAGRRTLTCLRCDRTAVIDDDRTNYACVACGAIHVLDRGGA